MGVTTKADRANQAAINHGCDAVAALHDADRAAANAISELTMLRGQIRSITRRLVTNVNAPVNRALFPNDTLSDLPPVA